MYAVQRPNGSRTYFNRGMCGVYEDPLKLAKACAARSGGTVMIEDQSKYVFVKNGKQLKPRWSKL